MDGSKIDVYSGASAGFFRQGHHTVEADNKVTVRGDLSRGLAPVGEPFTIAGANNPKVLAELIYRAVRAGIKLR